MDIIDTFGAYVTTIQWAGGDRLTTHILVFSRLSWKSTIWYSTGGIEDFYKAYSISDYNVFRAG